MAINTEAVEALRDVAEPHRAANDLVRLDVIETYITQHPPQYRIQLRPQYRERLACIPANLSKEQLDIELFKVQKDIELDHRQRAASIRAMPLGSTSGCDEYAALYRQYLDEENELGKAALARYVVHRRTILEMLENALKVQDTGAYAREDLIHSLIFPMRTTSDEVDFARQNLWVVDERLAYHTHLASDLPMSRLTAIDVDSRDEPDLARFRSTPTSCAVSRRGCARSPRTTTS